MVKKSIQKDSREQHSDVYWSAKKNCTYYAYMFGSDFTEELGRPDAWIETFPTEQECRRGMSDSLIKKCGIVEIAIKFNRVIKHGEATKGLK